MRRPLFTTGLPQIPAIADPVAAPASALSILDLRSLSDELQSVTRYVTLYAANQGSGAETLSIAFREGSDTPILLIARALTAGAMTGGPVKVLDRFPLRGDIQLLAGNGSGDGIVVWGYFELDGIDETTPAARPLQPTSALSSPYSYVPIQLEYSDAGQQIHLFNTDYCDLVTLDINITSRGSSDTGTLTVSDGVDSVSILFTDLTTETPTRVFDGIPMRAQGTDEVAGISATTMELVTKAWGTYVRVT